MKLFLQLLSCLKVQKTVTKQMRLQPIGKHTIPRLVLSESVEMNLKGMIGRYYL